jgi:proteasome lid subunit RPN8/RPN11
MESTTRRKPGGLVKFRLTNREECGVLVTTQEGLCYILKVPNRAENDRDYAIFLSDVEAVEAVLSEGEEVTGFMHTHLHMHECEPTPEDLRGAALFPKMVNLIYQPSTLKWCWYNSAGVIS